MSASLVAKAMLILLATFSSLTVFAHGTRVDSILQRHGPIFIDGNGGFTHANGVVSGAGTGSDPYVIEGWEFDLGSFSLCKLGSFCGSVTVENTTSHFVIRGVRFTGAQYYYRWGIYLNNVTDASVSDSLILPTQDLDLRYQFSDQGIFISNSTRIDVEGNGIVGGFVSSYLSNNITISGNSFYESGGVSPGGSGILIYHNNFYDSTQVSVSANPTIHWDAGYPAGGNYWGAPHPFNQDATPGPFPDNCSGPRQDICNGPDGISDLGYCVYPTSTNCSVDRYPLMKPYGYAPHIVPPLWPLKGLNVTSVSSSSILVTWPTPNPPDFLFSNVTSDIVAYRIYLGSQQHDIFGVIPCFGNGTLVGTVSTGTRTFLVSGLNASTHYVIWVEAVDSSANKSCLSTGATTVAVWQQYWYLIAASVIGGIATLLFLGYHFKWRRRDRRAPAFNEDLQHLTR